MAFKASHNPNKPPLLQEGDEYSTWKKRIQLWRRCTTIPKEGQAPAVALSLEGAAGSMGILFKFIHSVTYWCSTGSMVIHQQLKEKDKESAMSTCSYDAWCCSGDGAQTILPAQQVSDYQLTC